MEHFFYHYKECDKPFKKWNIHPHLLQSFDFVAVFKPCDLDSDLYIKNSCFGCLGIHVSQTHFYFQYLDLGRNEAAILAWRNATLFKPTHVNAWSSLYVSLILTLYYFQYLDIGRNEAAILAWRNATLLKPTHVNAWSNMIILFDNSSKFVTFHLRL